MDDPYIWQIIEDRGGDTYRADNVEVWFRAGSEVCYLGLLSEAREGIEPVEQKPLPSEFLRLA